MNILLTGGTGFIGRHLCHALADRGHELHILTRTPEKARQVLPEGAATFTDLTRIEADTSIDVIINLAGEGIADRRWSKARKKLLQESRVNTTNALGELVARLKKRPSLMISGSAIGFYGNAGAVELTEASPAVRRDFTYLLCDAWEQAARDAAGDMRLCILRTGVVLGRDGGLLKRLLPLYRLGLGARLGDGSQWLSWIHIQDMIALILRCVDSPGASGTFNAVAPRPVTHGRFHQVLAKTCHRPGLLRVPAFPLQVALGEMSVVMLGGQKVLPKRLMEQGFHFKYPAIEEALQDLVGK